LIRKKLNILGLENDHRPITDCLFSFTQFLLPRLSPGTKWKNNWRRFGQNINLIVFSSSQSQIVLRYHKTAVKEINKK